MSAGLRRLTRGDPGALSTHSDSRRVSRSKRRARAKHRLSTHSDPIDGRVDGLKVETTLQRQIHGPERSSAAASTHRLAPMHRCVSRCKPRRGAEIGYRPTDSSIGFESSRSVHPPNVSPSGVGVFRDPTHRLDRRGGRPSRIGPARVDERPTHRRPTKRSVCTPRRTSADAIDTPTAETEPWSVRPWIAKLHETRISAAAVSETDAHSTQTALQSQIFWAVAAT